MSKQEPQVASGVREGDILAGKYRIERILGVGGMGVVVAAEHIHLDDRVAIKFLLPEALGNPEAVARFAREARAAVKIKSEHVARVTDVGTLENHAPYMVMEYLEGQDLSGWLERGPLPIEQAVEFVLQACEAIAEAHSMGIVHRDLKPANLFVIRSKDGTYSVKVLDFGISKTTAPGRAGSDMTRTSAVMGSPLYMSPEQLRSSKDVDARSDIWSVGIILYELITGQSPFIADTMPELILQIISSAPPPMRNKRADTPPGLEQVILRCLEREREKRYPSVAELAVALFEFAPKRSRISVERISGVLRSSGSGSVVEAPPMSERPSERGQTAASFGRTTRKGGGSASIAVAAMAGVVVVATVAVILHSRGGTPSASVAPSTAASDLVAAAVTAAPIVTAALPPAGSAAAAPSAIPDAPVAPAPPAAASAPEAAALAVSPVPRVVVHAAPSGAPRGSSAKRDSRAPSSRVPTPTVAAPVAPVAVMPAPAAATAPGSKWGGRL